MTAARTKRKAKKLLVTDVSTGVVVTSADASAANESEAPTVAPDPRCKLGEAVDCKQPIEWHGSCAAHYREHPE